MPGNWIDHLPLLGGVTTGATMAFVGLRGVLLRRPFLMRGALLVALVGAGPLASLLPILREVIGDAAGDWPGTLWALAWPAAVVLFFLVVLHRMQGYAGFCASAAAFRTAVREAAAELGLAVHEGLSDFTVAGLDARFEVAVAGWSGLSQLRAATPDATRLLPALVSAMNRSFRRSREAPRLAASYSYAAIGLAILALASSPWWWFA